MLKLPEKILILRLSSIGDIALTTPIIRAIRNKGGNNIQIDFVVKKEFAELIKFNHHLSTIYELDTKGGFKELKSLAQKLKLEKYDLIIDLHNNLRTKYLRNMSVPKEVVSVNKQTFEKFKLIYFKLNSLKEKKHIVNKYFDALINYDVLNDHKGLEIFIPDEIQFSISSRISSLSLKNYNKVIGICPGAKHFTKIWPKEKFANVAVELSKKYNAKIFLFGSKSEMEITNYIASKIKIEVGENFVTNFSGKLSLLETTHAFEYCDLIITNDTGLMHLASAKKKPIVVIFGSSVKEFGFYPFETENIIVENNKIKCRPCSHIGKDNCPKKHFNCMNEILETEVINNAIKYL